MDRRSFIKTTACIGSMTLAAKQMESSAMGISKYVRTLHPLEAPAQSKVIFIQTGDRVAGVQKALEMLDIGSMRDQSVFIKPNFNSADPCPGSTHNEVLSTLVKNLQSAGSRRILVGDRSGMGNTRAAMEQKGIFEMAGELDFETVVFDELDADGWVAMQVEGGHWERGFSVAKPVLDADRVVQTCCLKTHGFGGHFTMSLKNTVGLVAREVPGDAYNYMGELHGSPHQRRLIAEMNVAYEPDFIVVDGIEAFVDGGPHRGTKVDAQVILAGTDRVALDAVGVAMLRHYGTTPAVSEGAVFEQEQIARAVELGLGVDSPEKIEMVTDDPASAAYAEEIRSVLLANE